MTEYRERFSEKSGRGNKRELVSRIAQKRYMDIGRVVVVAVGSKGDA